MQQQRGGEEAEPLAVAHLVVVHGVGARHAQQRVLPQPARLAEEVVCGERARDVALDHLLEGTLLGIQSTFYNNLRQHTQYF